MKFIQFIFSLICLIAYISTAAPAAKGQANAPANAKGSAKKRARSSKFVKNGKRRHSVMRIA